MGANSRLTIATHALAWMALNERGGAELTTSEQIAGSVKTNPVVIRRLMSEMGKAGLISSRRGANAGWQLAKAPEAISLWDIDDALGAEAAFACTATSRAPSARSPAASAPR